MIPFDDPISFVTFALALVVAITVHEFAHAFAADKLGDPTPRLQGRLTLNPLAHLDPLGTLMLFLVRFGWGKPVQFDPFNLQDPKRDAAIISFAGPASNMIVATIASLLIRLMFFITVPGPLGLFLSSFFISLIGINIILAVFNLIPIHPLDGFKIVGGFIPKERAHEWYSLQPYGIFFLLLLIFPMFNGSAPISFILGPALNFFMGIFLPQLSNLI